MAKLKGKFIVFEGPDGSGSSTHAKLLADDLNKKGLKTIHTKEPGKGPIGALTRTYLKNKKTDSKALQLLFAADRAHHLENVIEPALKKGINVVSDRYLYSSLAFGSLDLNEKWLEKINNEFRKPDYVFFLSLPAKECIKRVRKRKSSFQLFEDEARLDQVLRNYYKLAKKHGFFHTIESDAPIQEVHEKVLKILKV